MAVFKLIGVDAMIAKLVAINEAIDLALVQGLKAEAERVMAKSKKDYVPFDLGTLRSSGQVGQVERDKNGMQVKLTFGGAAAAYAEAVHEHPSSHSPPSWEGKAITSISDWSVDGRGPKYLTRAIEEARPGMADRVAKGALP